VNTFPGLTRGSWNHLLYQSDHLYVEITKDDVSPLLKPSMEAGFYKRAGRDGSIKPMLLQSGDLLLLTDVEKVKQVIWNKVLVAGGEYAWIPRILPAAIGRAEERVSIAYKFYFYRKDVGLLIVALFGFAWGFLNFRIKPI